VNVSYKRTATRREFLRAGLAAGAAPAIVRAAVRKETPNILVVMSDEHNHRVAGCYGNRTVRTPNIDRLAAEGVTFDTAYCNSPLCVPSRLAFTAGKYIHRTGAWGNDSSLPSAEYASLPRLLNSAGYESFLCGKQHYEATRRYGFTEIGGNMNRNQLNGRGVRRRADDETINVKAGLTRFAEFHTGEDSSTLSHDRSVTAGVLDFLARRGRAEKPFFLFAGYLAPHFPLISPERYWRNYRDRIDMPEIPPGFLEKMPLNYKHLRRGFGLIDVNPDIVRRGRELYYGLTQWVDDEIGKVLEALRKGPFAENTVIVYTTDHGENMGEHGLWWKNCVYEQAAHIPLVVSWPERWKGAQRRAGACSTVDLVKTIAEIGGTHAPADWDGTSMLGWLDRPSARWKDRAVSQYYGHIIASGYAMIRSGRWKYVYHSAPDEKHPAERELYDLEQDPKEFRNLAAEPASRAEVDRLHTALLKELGEHPDETERRCRADYARGYGAPESATS
jgi:choline-sulfatase